MEDELLHLTSRPVITLLQAPAAAVCPEQVRPLAIVGRGGDPRFGYREGWVHVAGPKGTKWHVHAHLPSITRGQLDVQGRSNLAWWEVIGQIHGYPERSGCGTFEVLAAWPRLQKALAEVSQPEGSCGGCGLPLSALSQSGTVESSCFYQAAQEAAEEEDQRGQVAFH